jgi:hypothetical protein
MKVTPKSSIAVPLCVTLRNYLNTHYCQFSPIRWQMGIVWPTDIKGATADIKGNG